MSQRQPPALNSDAVAEVRGSGYPEPFRTRMGERVKRRLGEAFGLTHFGVNLVTLGPGGQSALRHWHTHEDEFVYVLEGEITLVEDHGETVLKPGDAAGWKADSRIGHCLINRTQKDAVYIEVCTRAPYETAVYPDIDMRVERDKTDARYVKKTGEPYPVRKA